MKPVLAAKLTLAALALFEAAAYANTTCSPLTPSRSACVIEVDAKEKVQPLPFTMQPDVKVTIRVVRKSPFAAIKFESTRAEVAPESSSDKLFKYAAAALLGFPFPVLDAGDAPELAQFNALGVGGTPQASVEQFPSRESLKIILLRQESIRTHLAALETLVNASKVSIASYEAGAYATDIDFITATIRLKEQLAPLVQELAAKIPAGEIKLLTVQLEGITAAAKRTANIGALEKEHIWVSKLYERQASLEASAGQLNDALTDLRDILKTLTQLANQKTPFLAETTLTTKANTSVDTTITAKSYLDGTTEAVGKIKITGRPTSWLGLSAGVLVSSLVKTSYSVDSLRTGPAPTGGTVPTAYIIGESRSRPSVLPLGLVHLNPPNWRWRCGSSECGVGFAIGGGVNPFGDSTTGEFGAGLSLRIGRVYLSPILHQGRPLNLSGGYKVDDPVTKDFAVPTTRRWKPAFGFAFTYAIK